MDTKNISIIVAIAENNAIGKNNQLLVHISDDLKRFKKITSGHTVIMGKKTFESLPKGALPNRRNLVITDISNESFTGCDTAYSIEEAIEMADTNNENFIIGGGMIYRQFLPHANKLYLTKIHHKFEADIFFPEIDYSNWMLVEEEHFEKGEKCDHPVSYLTYKRI